MEGGDNQRIEEEGRAQGLGEGQDRHQTSKEATHKMQMGIRSQAERGVPSKTCCMWVQSGTRSRFRTYVLYRGDRHND